MKSMSEYYTYVWKQCLINLLDNGNDYLQEMLYEYGAELLNDDSIIYHETPLHYVSGIIYSEYVTSSARSKQFLEQVIEEAIETAIKPFESENPFRSSIPSRESIASYQDYRKFMYDNGLMLSPSNALTFPWQTIKSKVQTALGKYAQLR